MNVGQSTKRIVDVLLGAALFIVCVPLMILLALLVKLTSKGPVFYRQRRTGPMCPSSGRRVVYNVYKYRTIAMGDEMGVVRHGLQNCNFQITPLGKALRVTRLDLLPHLINLLRGDLSIFGSDTDEPELAAPIGR